MSVTKVKAKTEGLVKEKEFKESDERGEKVVAMKGGVVAKATVPSMNPRVEFGEFGVLESWLSLEFAVRFRVLLVCCEVGLNSRQDTGGQYVVSSSPRSCLRLSSYQPCKGQSRQLIFSDGVLRTMTAVMLASLILLAAWSVRASLVANIQIEALAHMAAQNKTIQGARDHTAALQTTRRLSRMTEKSVPMSMLTWFRRKEVRRRA